MPRWRRKLRRALAKPWYWASLLVPTRVAKALPYPVRHFIWKRAIRGI